MMTRYDIMLSRFPDAFSHTEESNIGKYLKVKNLNFEDIYSELEQMVEFKDINTAKGKILDNMGDLVGQPRGKYTDDQYRILIKTRIAINMSKGDYLTISSALTQIFQCGFDEILLIDSEEEPARVQLEKLSLLTLASAGFTTKDAANIIQSIIPCGVSLAADVFTGTFMFTEDVENSMNKGFSDETMTFGGYFGALLGED